MADYVTPAIGIVTGLWNAYQTRKTAEKATTTQMAAGNKAQGQLDAVYRQSSANFAPFIATGTQANSMLGTMMGMGGTATPTPSYAPPAQTAAQPIQQPPQQAPPTATPLGNTTPPQADTQMSLGQTMSASGPQSGYVRMQAPDGSVEGVHPSAVPHFQQRGARVIQ